MTTNNTQLVFDRFRPDSIGGRILALLTDGKPRTVPEIARFAKPRSAENILVAGGWYSLLRCHGKRSKLFDLTKTNDGKLLLTIRRKPARQRRAA